MNLFNPTQTLTKGHNSDLHLSTPLGVLQFEFSFNEKRISSIQPSQIFLNQTTALARWNLDECLVEFVKIQFTPKLPVGMNVDKCFAGIWRIKSLSKILNPVFRTYLVSDHEGSPESGEGLISQLFENNLVNLSIGTEDEEYLTQRAEINQWMPERLKDSLKVEAVDLIPGGIQTIIPSLETEERIQVHSIVAWSQKSTKESSTLFAVDQSTDFILASKGFT